MISLRRRACRSCMAAAPRMLQRLRSCDPLLNVEIIAQLLHVWILEHRDRGFYKISRNHYSNLTVPASDLLSGGAWARNTSKQHEKAFNTSRTASFLWRMCYHGSATYLLSLLLGQPIAPFLLRWHLGALATLDLTAQFIVNSLRFSISKAAQNASAVALLPRLHNGNVVHETIELPAIMLLSTSSVTVAPACTACLAKARTSYSESVRLLYRS